MRSILQIRSTLQAAYILHLDTFWVILSFYPSDCPVPTVSAGDGLFFVFVFVSASALFCAKIVKIRPQNCKQSFHNLLLWTPGHD